MVLSLLLPIVRKAVRVTLESPGYPFWTQEELNYDVNIWLIILSAPVRNSYVMLYHSERCNIYGLVLRNYYVND
jgi:hypothetical protein